jgi:hypothetical protein
MVAGSARSASWLAVLLCVPALGACGEEEGGEQSAPDSPLLTLNAESGAWPAAEIRGALTEEEGCLLIGESVAVFPLGTVWRSPDVVFADGTSVRVGSEVNLGGGQFIADDVTADDLPVVPVEQVQECARRTSVTTFVWARPS